MDILIIEPLDPEALAWLSARHAVRYEPELADEPLRLRQSLVDVRALIIPPSVSLDAFAIQQAPMLRAVGRLSSGAENIDIEACLRANIEVVRPKDASSVAEAEFAVGALLQLLRRVPVVNAEGLLVGRELSASTIGLLGMTSTARPLARLLQAFGARVIGYDPALHVSDPAWQRHGVAPLALRELFAQSDGVCVLLSYFSRYHGLIGERFLDHCKANQVVVSLAPASLFDEAALSYALGSGRLAGAWFDSVEPGMLDPGRPLHGADTLQVTPRVAGTTRESRQRGAWAVARRVSELLSPHEGLATPTGSKATAVPALSAAPTSDLAGLSDAPPTA